MEKYKPTFQWLEESGEIDIELMRRLNEKRAEQWEPTFFIQPPFQLTDAQELAIRMQWAR